MVGCVTGSALNNGQEDAPVAVGSEDQPAVPGPVGACQPVQHCHAVLHSEARPGLQAVRRRAGCFPQGHAQVE